MSHKKFLAFSFFYLLGLATMGLYIKGISYFYFKYRQTEFDKSYISCSEAISSDRQFKDKTTDVDPKLIDSSASVMKLTCLDAKKITNHLLEFGVSDKLIKSHINDLMATPQGRTLALNKPSIFDINKRQLLIYLISVLATTAIGIFVSINWEWGGASSVDEKLKVAIELNELKPLQIRQYYPDKKYILGQALFFDPILSGNRNMSCASCHLLSKGLSDGRPFSIGPNEGHFSRDLTQNSIEQGVRKRNAPDLWNRDANPVKNLFLDGRIEVLDGERKLFRSPLEDILPKQFQNALEVQAIFPLAAESEMSGLFGDITDNNLPAGHANKKNDLILKSKYRNEKEKILSIHNQLLDRLLSKHGKPEPWQVTYRGMFNQAYPTVKTGELTIYHVGSAIGHFEELAFAANNSRWDQYLEGKTDVLNSQEKLGALVFYGKGYCSYCHTGSLFSDFKFHQIGVISDPLLSGNGYFEDLGRYNVTRKDEDKYKFRTAPLRNITKSAPYFHDGSTSTLHEAIIRHTDPLKYADSYREDGGLKMEKRHIETISPVILNLPKFTDEEIIFLQMFLKTLESQSRSNSEIFPDSVPSGLKIGAK